ncbi:MAG: hypothetical protein R3F35_03065 [Myxococcota bacterium]
MQETTRAQGWAICGGAGFAALLFVIGVLRQSWWAIAIPVSVLTLFALGLVAWVGYTIATIQVEADQPPEVLSTEASATSNASAPSGTSVAPGASVKGAAEGAA